MPPIAPTMGSNACRKEESSPTSTSRFISSPMEKKKRAINASLMKAIIDIGSP